MIIIINNTVDLSHIGSIAGFIVIQNVNYLESVITNKGSCETERRRRCFGMEEPLWTD